MQFNFQKKKSHISQYISALFNNDSALKKLV